MANLEKRYTIEDAKADLQKSVSGLINFLNGAYSLWDHRGWELLGYESWDALCAREYRYRLKDPITRLEAVEALTNRGMSTTAIAAAVGYSQPTIARDVQALIQMNRVAPDRTVVGLNNQEYPQEQERAEQTIQLVKDQESATARATRARINDHTGAVPGPETEQNARRNLAALRATTEQLNKDARQVMRDLKDGVLIDGDAYMKVIWRIENALEMIYPDHSVENPHWPEAD